MSRSSSGGSTSCEEGTSLMEPMHRRRFLSSLGRTGALLAAGSWLDLIGYAQVSRGPARAFIQPSRHGEFDRRVLGAFLEHLGRAIYTGVYEPGSKLGPRRGFPPACWARGRDSPFPPRRRP